MAGNFVSASNGQSEYISAKLNSFSAATKMKQAEESSATALLNEFGGINGPSLYDPHVNRKNGGESEAIIRKKLMQKAGKKIIENAEEDFENTKKRLEDQANKATAPKDENGNPIPDITELGLEPAPLTDAVVAPELATGGAGAPDFVGAATAPDSPNSAGTFDSAEAAITTGPAAEPAVEVLTPTAPVAPKIYIDLRV